MNKLFLYVLTTFLSVVLQSFQSGQPDAIYYVSLNRAIHLGQYDGSMTVKTLKSHGDFGLGSAERLAGEFVLLDGEAYTIPADGKAKLIAEEAKIPFAAVKFFVADHAMKIPTSMSWQQLKEFLDSQIKDNAFAAIKIKAHFSHIKFRSYQEQTKPYKPVDEVPVQEFERSGIDGTLVGFFTPKSAEVLNSPVYHFHFIDKNKTTGGHLLDCNLEDASIDIDYSRELNVGLPDASLMKNIDLGKPIGEEQGQ